MSFRAFDPRGAASPMCSLPAGGKFQRLANGVQTGGTNDLA